MPKQLMSKSAYENRLQTRASDKQRFVFTDLRFDNRVGVSYYNKQVVLYWFTITLLEADALEFGITSETRRAFPIFIDSSVKDTLVYSHTHGMRSDAVEATTAAQFSLDTFNWYLKDYFYIKGVESKICWMELGLHDFNNNAYLENSKYNRRYCNHKFCRSSWLNGIKPHQYLYYFTVYMNEEMQNPSNFVSFFTVRNVEGAIEEVSEEDDEALTEASDLQQNDAVTSKPPCVNKLGEMPNEKTASKRSSSVDESATSTIVDIVADETLSKKARVTSDEEADNEVASILVTMETQMSTRINKQQPTIDLLKGIYKHLELLAFICYLSFIVSCIIGCLFSCVFPCAYLSLAEYLNNKLTYLFHSCCDKIERRNQENGRRGGIGGGGDDNTTSSSGYGNGSSKNEHSNSSSSSLQHARREEG